MISESYRGIIGFVCGAFDLLHPGHLHLLNSAGQKCDKLFVGLHTDPTIDRPLEKQRPVQTTYERHLQLAMLSFVYCIVPYDTEQDLKNILSISKIDKRFLGSDYEGEEFTAKKVCEERGIELVYIPRLHGWSSTELRNRVVARTNHPNTRKEGYDVEA